MGKHRSRLTILADVLSVIGNNDGAKKTQIMYQAYLSYNLLVQYLRDVTEAGLVVCGDENCYKLTPKGEKFLTRFVEYDKTREQIDRQLNNIETQKNLLEKMCTNTNPENSDSSNLEKNLEHRNA